MNTGGIIIIEPTTTYFQNMFRVVKIYAYEKSKYQEIVLAELDGFGKALIIDKLIQSTERDEYLYHESLVQPVMVIHPNPRRVLILGGGEGASLREVLKHNCVVKAVMVDIDESVVEFSKRYLEFIHKNSFYDKRVEVVIMNGYDYVINSPENSFDIVIMDLTDPYSSEIAKPLYTEEFFREINRILAEDGLVATQAGNSFFYNKAYKNVYENMRKVFKYVAEYWVWIPSFAYACNFLIGSKKYNPYDIDAKDFNERLVKRGVVNRFMNGDRYVGLIKTNIVIGDLEK
ncbi:MAG: methyltransferase domain-containing protein [Desulfurococcaceae archaeon]